MNILYYLEPQVEMNDALFRYGTLKSLLIPETLGLKKVCPDWTITVVINQKLKNKLDLDGVDYQHVNLVTLETKALEQHFGEDAHRNSLDLYRGQLSADRFASIQSFLTSSIACAPDIVMTYESMNGVLRSLFPDALHLNQMFGGFSRAPFPSFCCLDVCGLFEHSFLAQHHDDITIQDLNDDEKEVLRQWRRQMLHALSSYFPFKKDIERYKSKFSSLVLLATQVDGYFAFNACTDFVSTYDLIESVMMNTPKEVGVIVTEHHYGKGLTAKEKHQLQNAYVNVVFLDVGAVSFPSQCLMSYMDGLITVSSSLAYQALLWQKPLLCLGKSQVTPLATTDEHSKFIEQVQHHQACEQDALLYFIVSQYHLNYKFDVFDGQKYARILMDYWDLFQEKSSPVSYYAKRKNYQQVDFELKQSHQIWRLKQEAKQCTLPVDKDYLRMSLCEHNYVSFDLFDTLVERDFVEPYDLFLVTEKQVRTLIDNKNFDFVYFRRTAEADARRPTLGRFEIGLDDIYRHFQTLTNLDEKTCHKIQKMEVENEVRYVSPKSRMLEEYRLTHILNKTTAIISDIYLDEGVIRSILSACQIDGFDLLLLSSEEKSRKQNGTLYPTYLEKLKVIDDSVTASRCLHIGDNKLADGDMAKQHGLHCYTFPKAMENYRKSAIGEFMDPSLRTRSKLTSFLNGVIANRFYSAHWNYRDKRSVFHAHTFEYGYVVIGPLVAGFSQWLAKELKSDGIKQAYFLSRDGWLFKQSFETLSPNSPIESYYLYSSRRCAMVASIRNLTDIQEIASQSFNERPLNDFIESRFGVEWNDFLNKVAKRLHLKSTTIVSPKYRYADLMLFLSKISHVIIKHAKKEREAYLDYLDDMGFLEAVKRKEAAVIDIGYSGSMQFYLKKMLNIDQLPGYYFLTHLHALEGFEGDIFKGYLANYDDHRNGFRHPLNDHVFIFESALSSPEGSFIKFDGKGKQRQMVLLDAEAEQQRVSVLKDIHLGARAFFGDFYQKFVARGNTDLIPSVLSSALITRFSNAPKPKDVEMFLNFEVENVFGGGSVCLISDYSMTSFAQQAILPQQSIDLLVNHSKWKQGAKVYFNQNQQGQSLSTLTKSLGQKSETSATSVKASSGLSQANSQALRTRKLMQFSSNPYAYLQKSSNEKLNKISFLFNPDKKIGQYSSLIASTLAKKMA